MAQRGFDEQMEALDALRGQPVDAAAEMQIRKALAGKSNFLAAKAARLAEEAELTSLLPEMIAAFHRFYENAEKSDPQCWAKNAISRALPRLGCRDKEAFLRGIRFHQWEPTWGGKSDTAGTLRANCAHALVACEDLPNRRAAAAAAGPAGGRRQERARRSWFERWRKSASWRFRFCVCAR